MGALTCKNCKSSKIEYDAAAGNAVCIECGTVLEENSVVSEVTFAEMADGSSMLQGQFVSSERGRTSAPTIFGRNRGGMGGMSDGVDSREWTLFNAKRRLQAVGSALGGLGEHHIEQAYRWYTLALQHQFTRGRRANHVVAACLYIVCRIEKTAHMLLDFSDALQTSVYVVGATFLRLVQLLNLQLPIIDPSFYIGRFAAKLEFGDKTHTVTTTALRVVARMKRDWIQVGRRPAGVCAAGLLIAGRMHGFDRSEREVVRVVHICEATLKRRLAEFAATPSSSLTPDEFEQIWLEVEADPPSFTRARQQEQLTLMEAEKTQAAVEQVMLSWTPPLTPEEEPEQAALLANTAGFDNLLMKPPKPPVKKVIDEDPDDFRDLDADPELDAMLLTPSESSSKEAIWTALNREYLNQQAEKARELEERLTPKFDDANNNDDAGSEAAEDQAQMIVATGKKPRKKRISAPRKPPLVTPASVAPVADTAIEAATKVLQSKRFSRKINYEALQSLFEAETGS